jgi:hypothetical protein
MKKIISASFLAVLALTMLLPVAQQVNASSVNHPILRQGTAPMNRCSGISYLTCNEIPVI